MPNPAPIWWMVRVLPYDFPHHVKHYGPFKREKYAIDFVRRFDNTLAEAMVFPLVRQPGPTRTDQYMRGYQPPKEFPQPEQIELEAEL